MVGRTTPYRKIQSFSWCKLRGERIHFACMLPEETTITIVFGQNDTDEAKLPCDRCGVPLRETPDP